jgi:NAD(P)H-hydrate epimerase
MKGTHIIHITQEMVFGAIPFRPQHSHKGTFGRLLNVSGSFAMSGAAVLSTLGAQRAGVGLVTVACSERVIPIIAPSIREAVYLPLPDSEDFYGAAARILAKLKDADACMIGCGMGNNAATAHCVGEVIRNAACPVVVDADGLNAICGETQIFLEAKMPLILTPHLKEASRLMHCTVDQIAADKIGAGCAFARQYRVFLALKDSTTYIFTPDGAVYENTAGNSGLAKGGSGDVLTGVIASLCAQGIGAEKAAVCGVWLHGRAGEKCSARLSQTAMQPSDMLYDLAMIFSENGR